MTNPLSIKYQPGFTIRYGWCGMSDSMETFVKKMDNIEDSRLHLREALLYIYMNNEAFREALASCSDMEACVALFELDDVKNEVAQVYIEELANLRLDAIACRDADTRQILTLVSEARGKDSMFDPITLQMTGGPHVKRLSELGRFNKNYQDLVDFFLKQYSEHIVRPYAATGIPSFLNPVTFCGWGGPDSIGQTFSFLSELFENGYIEIECDNWEEWNCPDIIEEWSSGVKVVRTDHESVILECDTELIKSEVPIAGKMIPVSSCGKYVVSIEECGEFIVNIYYRSKDMSERICVFTYDFCCK